MSHAESFDPGPPPTNVVFRTFAPVRLLACLVGVLATAAALSLFLTFFGGPGPVLSGWWDDPRAQFERLAAALTPAHYGAAAWRWLVAAALVFPVWGVVGAFVVRADLAARYRPHDDGEAARFAGRRLQELAILPAPPILLVMMLAMPCMLGAALLAWFGGGGAVAVGVLLPVFFVANFAAMIFAIGLASFPLMPVSRAFEGPAGDTFDALSRSINYAGIAPLTWLIGMALSVAAFAAFAAPFAVVFQEYPPGSAPTLLWPVGAAFGFAAFWGVQTALYAYLRLGIDAVEPAEVGWEEVASATPPPATGEEPKPVAETPAPVPRPSLARRVRGSVTLLVLAALGWLLMAETLSWAGGSAGWVRWWEEPAEPRAGGVRVAAYFAQFWTVAFLLLFVTTQFAQHRRAVREAEPADSAESPPPPGG